MSDTSENLYFPHNIESLKMVNDHMFSRGFVVIKPHGNTEPFPYTQADVAKHVHRVIGTISEDFPEGMYLPVCDSIPQRIPDGAYTQKDIDEHGRLSIDPAHADQHDDYPIFMYHVTDPREDDETGERVRRQLPG